MGHPFPIIRVHIQVVRELAIRQNGTLGPDLFPGCPVTRTKLVKALMLPCSSMIDSTMGAIILA